MAFFGRFAWQAVPGPGILLSAAVMGSREDGLPRNQGSQGVLGVGEVSAYVQKSRPAELGVVVGPFSIKGGNCLM